MVDRPYQTQYINGIQPNKSNLLISTMRSGKSHMLERIIDKHFAGKRVLVLVGMRNIVLQLANYFPDHTFILAGKHHDDTKHIHLATFQTFVRRDVDLSSYDLIAIDEAHMRYDTTIVKQIRALNCTRLFMTGTPLKPNGRFLDPTIDNILEFTSMKQMLEDGYLAPTRFISRYNLLASESEIGVKGGEYVDVDVERILDKQAVVDQLVADATEFKWATEHKCILYVNSITTATKVFDAFADPFNVRVIHSKLTKQQLADVTDWYGSTDHGIIINVRMLTIGYDSPSTDTILYLTPTRIVSLFLQSVWRASTLNGDKVASVYDYSGTLGRINPFFNDWRKAKPTCREQCESIRDPMQRFFCQASCKSDPPMSNCTGQLPYSFIDNPYVSNFTVHAGSPCGESVPSFECKFKTTEPAIGISRRWRKCKCGTVTYYDIETLQKPSEMVELYQAEVKRDTVTVVYSREHKKAIAAFDCLNKSSYSIFKFNSSQELYEKCLEYFPSTFQIVSNIAMPKLPNVAVDKSLDFVLSLITDWDSDNKGLVRKLIKAKCLSIVDFLGMKKGFVYYFMKGVTSKNEKEVLEFLNGESINRQKLSKFSQKISP